MTYHVRYRRRAERELEKLAEGSTLEWFDDLVSAIESLEEFPDRCAFAPDSGLRGKRIRQLLFGDGHSTYRILYRVMDENVDILTIRPSRRQPLRR